MDLKYICLLIIFLCSIFSIKIDLSESIETRYMKNNSRCTKEKVYEADRKFLLLQTIGKSGRKFPTDYKELSKFCAESTRLTNELEKFVIDCYRSELSNIMKIGIYSIKRMLKQFCGKKKKSKKMDKLLNVAKCINTVIDKMPCVDEAVERTQELVKYKIEDQKITHTCCNVAHALKCTDAFFEKLECMTSRGQELANDFLRLTLGDLINVMCGEYNESSDKCDSVPWPPPISKKDPNVKIDENIKSLVFMAIELVQSIEKFNADIK